MPAPPLPLTSLARLLREVGGAQTVEWALGAGAEQAKEAQEEAAFDLFGSIFGGPLIGSRIGEAIGAERGTESDGEAAILAPAEPSFGAAADDDD